MMRTLLPSSPLGITVFVVIIAIGIFLRIAGLTWGIPTIENQSSVYHDEGHVLGSVLVDWEGYKKEFGEYEIVRPVFFWRITGRPLMTIGKQLGLDDMSTRIFEIATLRSITAIVAIIGLFATYVLGRKLGTSTTGLWAMSFLVFMPGHWYYSQILKGDVMVATFFVLILLSAISIAERGRRWAYVIGGIVFGAGVAIKATIIIAAPVLLLAHVLFIWKQKQWKNLLGVNAWLIFMSVVISFLVLYPYPFIDLPRLQQLLAHPTTQHFNPVLFVNPQRYIDAWLEYNSLQKPFGEMIYGKFLLWTVVPLFVAIIFISLRELLRKKRTDLILVVTMALLFTHSLTFTAVLDERYLLPSAPIVALFPALIITGVGFKQRHWLKILNLTVGSILLAGTVAITWLTFPSFALNNPREQVIDWINRNAPAGSTIAQPSQLSRWALRVNRDVYKVANIVDGEGEYRHIDTFVTADYLIIQRDPWNWDHSFRYELDGLSSELQSFLQQYRVVQTFGKVQNIFGWRIPQNLGTPVIDIYKAHSIR